MRSIISQLLEQSKSWKKFIQFVGPIVSHLVDIGFYIFCFGIYFIKPLVDSIIQKRQKEAIENKQFMKSRQEYETLLDDIQLLKQSKKNYQQQIKILRQEISWSNDRLTLVEWGKDVTHLDEYRKKLEEEWNRAMRDEEASDTEDES